MAEPLTHKPFEQRLMALNADKLAPSKKSNVTHLKPPSTKERASREPDRAFVEAPPVEAPEVAAKKSGKVPKRVFIEANPGMGVTELVELGKKRGIKFTASYVYNVRSVGKGNPTKGKRGKAAAKRSKASREPLPEGRKKRSPVTSRFVEALSEILAPMVSELVTAEIRKRLA